MEEERNNVAKLDLDLEKPKIKQAVSPNISKTEIKQKKKGEDKLCGGYNKGSKKMQIRYQKSAHELKKKVSKTYNIQAL